MTTRERRLHDRINTLDTIIAELHDEIEAANERVRSDQKLVQDFQAAITEVSALKELDQSRRKEIQLLRKNIAALYNGLAEEVLALTDEEILKESREDGVDPRQIAQTLRAGLLNSLKTHQQR